MVKKQAPQMTKHQRSHQMFFRSLYTVVFTLSMLNLQGIDGHQHCAFTTNRVIPSFHSVTVAQQKQSHFMGSTMHFTPSISTKNPPTTSRSSTALKMSFLGNDGGFFGVGAPEIAVTLLVGYFILGPQDLYKLVKEIGKAFNTLRTASADATREFESTMENTIQMDEVRKAQRELQELNDVFSFRRSINVDEDADPFLNKKNEGSVDPKTGVVAAAGAVEEKVSETIESAPVRKKKKRRRLKKKVEEPVATPTMEDQTVNNKGIVEDLDVSDAFKSTEEQAAWEAEMAAIQKSRNQRLKESGTADWFTASEEAVAEEVLSQQPQNQGPVLRNYDDDLAASDAQSRFASQLAGTWNEQILANEDKLSPLSKIMERLAILEEEKNAADLRLEEEFRLRGEVEEKFYRQKRELLEEAAADVQASAYIGLDDVGPEKDMKEQTSQKVENVTKESKEDKTESKSTSKMEEKVEIKAEEKKESKLESSTEQKGAKSEEAVKGTKTVNVE